MMMSNNPMFLQEQDFQARHSDLLQAAREGKAWEPAQPTLDAYGRSLGMEALPDMIVLTQMPPQKWRYISRIASIDTTDVSEASPRDLVAKALVRVGAPANAAEERAGHARVIRYFLPGNVHFIDRKCLSQADTHTIEFSKPCDPNEW